MKKNKSRKQIEWSDIQIRNLLFTVDRAISNIAFSMRTYKSKHLLERERDNAHSMIKTLNSALAGSCGTLNGEINKRVKRLSEIEAEILELIENPYLEDAAKGEEQVTTRSGDVSTDIVYTKSFWDSYKYFGLVYGEALREDVGLFNKRNPIVLDLEDGVYEHDLLQIGSIIQDYVSRDYIKPIPDRANLIYKICNEGLCVCYKYPTGKKLYYYLYISIAKLRKANCRNIIFHITNIQKSAKNQ